MSRTTKDSAPEVKGDEVALMYPGSQLREQVRDVRETQTAFSVVKAAFFPEK